MDTVTLLINLISMIATVISCIIAVKAKNEANVILSKIKNYNINAGNQIIQDNKLRNKGNIDINNSGSNSGIIGGIVTGGINKGDK